MTEKQSHPFLRDTYAGRSVKSACGITIDIGRQRLTAKDLKGLFKLAEEKGVLEANAKMRSGEIVNESEHRPALHTALRDTSVSAPFHKEVTEALNHLCNFAEDVRSGLFCGCRGDAITDIINIGIGGSEMGPRAVWHALRYVQPSIRLHFLSAADGVLFDRIVSGLNPFKTLVVVSSKSFGTRETMVNAAAVDQWLLDAGITGKDRNHHMVVVSAKRDAAEQMNLPEANLFPIWVEHRTSLRRRAGAGSVPSAVGGSSRNGRARRRRPDGRQFGAYFGALKLPQRAGRRGNALLPPVRRTAPDDGLLAAAA